MKLDWIEFENLRTGLKIEKVSFNEDITLLVGLSGVGKTQILKAVEYSLKLAINKNLRLEPYDVSLGFRIGNKEYVWSYRIEQDTKEDFIESREIKYAFIQEDLLENGKSIISRKLDKVRVIGYDKIPTPKKDESLLVQYSEDDFIRWKWCSKMRKAPPRAGWANLMPRMKKCLRRSWQRSTRR